MYNQENYNRLLLYVGFGIFCLLFLIPKVDFDNIKPIDVVRSMSTATLITLIFHFVFKKWIWKFHWIPLLNPMVVLVPNLHGTWKGELKSSWVNPETGEGVEPIQITAFIRQTFTSISVEMKTGQMTSKSYIAGIRSDSETDTKELCFTYTSKAYADNMSGNPWHDGTAKLEIDSGLKLKGNYWTLRKTIGVIELKRVNKKIFNE